MFRFIIKIATAAFLLLPIYATAEPIKLKLSFFTSDRSSIYQYSIRPFVDAASEASADILAEYCKTIPVTKLPGRRQPPIKISA